MNAFPLFSELLTTALGWALVHTLWQGTSIALAVAFLLRLTQQKPASFRYSLSIGALGLQLLTFLITFWICYEPVKPVMMMSGDQPAVISQTAVVMKLTTSNNWPSDLAGWLKEQLPLLVTIWFGGAAFLLIRLLGGWLYVQRLARRNSHRAPEAWQQYSQRLADQLGITRTVQLIESADISVPMTIGWLKPVILIPIGLLSGLSPRQVEAVLAHELAHIRRYDYLINMIQSAVEIVLFFHPAIWWLSARIREEREHCCDDIAINICGERASLAQALVHIEKQRQTSLTAPTLAMAFGARKPSFIQRVKRVIGVNEPQLVTRSNGWMAAGLLVLLTGLVLGQNIYPPTPASQPENDSITINSWKPETNRQSELPNDRRNHLEKPAFDPSLSDTINPIDREKMEKALEKQAQALDRQASELETLNLPLEKLHKQLEQHDRQLQELTEKEMGRLQEKLQQLHHQLERNFEKSEELDQKQLRMDGKLSRDEAQMLAKLHSDADRLQKQMKQLETGEMAKVHAKIQALTDGPMRQVRDSMDLYWEKAIKAYNDNMPYFIQLAEKHARLLDSLPKPEPVPALAPVPNGSVQPSVKPVPALVPSAKPHPARVKKPAGVKGEYWYNGKRYERPEEMPAAPTPPDPPAEALNPPDLNPPAEALHPPSVPDAPAPPKARKPGKKGVHVKN